MGRPLGRRLGERWVGVFRGWGDLEVRVAEREFGEVLREEGRGVLRAAARRRVVTGMVLVVLETVSASLVRVE